MARPITKSGLYLKFDIGLLADIDAAAPARGRTAWIEEACRERLLRDAALGPAAPAPEPQPTPEPAATPPPIPKPPRPAQPKNPAPKTADTHDPHDPIAAGRAARQARAREAITPRFGGKIA